MSTYVDVFVTQNIVGIHRAFAQVMAEADEHDRLSRAAGLPIRTGATRLEIARAYRFLNHELDDIARSTSLRASAAISFHFRRTAKRPATGIGGVHLRNLIRCRPLPKIAGFSTGAVGIADVDVLDRAIDPLYPDSGEYWRAQEYGTTHQAGREVRGFFYDAGFRNPTRPIAGHPGNQPLFVPGSILRGPGGKSGDSRGGVMHIGREIQARHFIRDGSTDALAVWRARMAAVDRNTARQLLAIRASALGGIPRGIRRTRLPRL